MQFDIPREDAPIIKVIGVGGGGSNAVNHMFRQGIKGVDFIVCNTDAQALQISPVSEKIQLGASLTEGRGAGSLPEVGRNAAIENIEELKTLLGKNTKMVFITAGMGGGTGTGAAPIIAQAAKEMGILTVGIVTVPFLFEGKKRKSQADTGIEELKNNVDSLIIICNDKLREMYGNLKLSAAFGHADDILTVAAKGIAEIITVTGYVNVDFEDVKTAVKDSGVAIMGSAVAEGDNRAIQAIENALNSPLLNDNNIKGARYILLNIASGSREVTMDEIGEITDYIQEEAGLTAEIIWGNCIDDTLDDKISVTLIATGFKTREELGKEDSTPRRTVRNLYDEPQTNVVAPAPPLAVNLDPVLVTKEDVQEAMLHNSVINNESLELELEVETNSLSPAASASTPVTIENKEEDMTSRKVYDLERDDLMDNDLQTQLKRSEERIKKLKSMSFRLNNTSNIADLEQEPAYVRKNIKLDSVPHSSQAHVSRLVLTNDEEKKPELRQGNSFLHDSVD